MSRVDRAPKVAAVTRARSLSLALPAMCIACAGAPSIFSNDGASANRISTLGWFLTIIACAVTAIVTILLLGALFRSRPAHHGDVQRGTSGIRWIVIGGVVVPGVILVVAFVTTVRTQAALAHPPRSADTAIQVVGHRWWWEVRYANGSGASIVTANELHVPVGQPVRLELTSADVIHSFWVPRLAGKTDVIPGQHNTMWMQADAPGVYRGQCAEYCGVQHAEMALVVIAEPRAQYDAWLATQRASASAPTDSMAERGSVVFQGAMCASCHTIRGSNARGQIGPDLTHLESRRTLAAGALSNTKGNLAGWIANAQSIKPGSAMPTIALPSADSRALLAYLETLR